ncbi:MAG: hypothetical protein EHM21_03120 [Chloroflexi bacterium]|nr:MAG: hypothetical protein EHM21_03120 [Chloroflexota bacterium]
MAASAAIEVGAIGLGTLIAALATTVAADVTGILLASLIAALGLFVIPNRRRKAKAEMSVKVTELRENLAKSLGDQFHREIERSVHDINEAIAPYTRFVRAERGKLQETQAKLEGIQVEMDRLKTRIEAL